MSTQTVAIQPERKVIRCERCKLVQYRPITDECRKCFAKIPVIEPVKDVEPIATIAPVGERRSLCQKKWGRSPDSPADRKIRATLGHRLNEQRLLNHLTQLELATASNMPRTYISRIENGRLMPGPSILGRIAKVLNISELLLLPIEKTKEQLIEGYFELLSREQQTEVLGHVAGIVNRNRLERK